MEDTQRETATAAATGASVAGGGGAGGTATTSAGQEAPPQQQARQQQQQQQARQPQQRRLGLIKVLNSEYPEVWIDLDSEDVCNKGTHTQKDRAHSRRPSGERQGERQGGGGLGPARYAAAPSPVSSSSPWGRTGSQQGRPAAAGSVGLANLGNTCFMNSMLQCLYHAAPLTECFLGRQSKAYAASAANAANAPLSSQSSPRVAPAVPSQHQPAYKLDVNRRNPLGTGGRLAEAYADLVRKVFSGAYSVVVPKEFKAVLGKHAPQFAGYQQQDSQEFMSFLLDGLHEDLNRVVHKPYTEAVEGGDNTTMTDQEVASEAWRRHLLRNDSVVVDRFQGLLRSHLTCPECHHQSVTFDPYMSLSLPLPTGQGPGPHGKATPRTREMWVTVVPLPSRGGLPRRLRLRVPLAGSVADLRRAALEAVPELRYLCHGAGGHGAGGHGAGGHGQVGGGVRVCDVWQHRIYKVLRNSERLVEIRVNDETYIYEVAHAPPLPSEHNGTNGQRRSSSSRSRSGGGGGGQRRGAPATSVRFCDVLMAQEGEGSSGGGRGSSGGSGGGGGGRGSIQVSAVRGAPPFASSGAGGTACTLFGAPFHLSYDGTTTVAEVRTLVGAFAGQCLTRPEAVAVADAETAAAAARFKPSTPAASPRDANGGGGRGGARGGGAEAAEAAEGMYRVFVSTAEGEVLGAELGSGPGGDKELFADWFEGGAGLFSGNNGGLLNGGGGGGGHGGSGLPGGSGGAGGGGGGSGQRCCLAMVWGAPALRRLSPGALSGWADAAMRRQRGSGGGGGGGGANGLQRPYGGQVAAQQQQQQVAAQQQLEEAPNALELEECLKLFTEREQLGEDDLWYCGKCRAHVAAYKKFDLWSTPDVLVLHLKRFEYVPGQYFMHRQKIDALVRFPLAHLDLGPMVLGPKSSDSAYELFAVSEHMGGLGGGHYTATARNLDSGGWFHCDDTRVTEVSPSSAVTPNAYVLFYKRKGPPHRWAGITLPPPGKAEHGKAKAAAPHGTRSA